MAKGDTTHRPMMPKTDDLWFCSVWQLTELNFQQSHCSDIRLNE